MRADYSLDCFGLLCPMPIIKISEKIKEMKTGEVLEVVATDEGIKPDAEAWCRSTGNEFLGVVIEEGDPKIFKVYIKKIA